jgi:aminopeptidase N
MDGDYAYTPQMWPSLLTVVLLVALAIFSWRRRAVPGARVFAVSCLVAVLHGGDGAPADGALEFPTVHEVAHQWWYAVVGNDVLLEPWLDESFANYSVVVYYEDVYGQEMAGEVYRDRIVGAYDRIQGTGQDGPVGRSVYDFSQAAQPSGPILYGKGAVFLHTLRQEVGDEAFFAILRHRYQRYKYQVATGEELLTDAEGVTGQDLGELFEVWIGPP